MTETWYAFTAFNQQAHYGYGSGEEASKYQDYLNRDKLIGHYSVNAMSDEESAALESGRDTDGFRLDLALDAIADQEEAEAADRARQMGWKRHRDSGLWVHHDHATWGGNAADLCDHYHINR